MPRIGGVNIVGVLVATLVFYFVGFIFYGVLFSETWTSLMGIAEADMAEADQTLGMLIGFLNALLTVVFIAIVQRMTGIRSPADCIMLALVLAIGFAVTSLAYDSIYALAPVKLLLIDSAHLIVAYILSSLILHFMD